MFEHLQQWGLRKFFWTLGAMICWLLLLCSWTKYFGTTATVVVLLLHLCNATVVDLHDAATFGRLRRFYYFLAATHGCVCLRPWSSYARSTLRDSFLIKPLRLMPVMWVWFFFFSVGTIPFGRGPKIRIAFFLEEIDRDFSLWRPIKKPWPSFNCEGF